MDDDESGMDEDMEEEEKKESKWHAFLVVGLDSSESLCKRKQRRALWTCMLNRMTLKRVSIEPPFAIINLD